MTVECRLAHRMGHTESISMTAPIDQAAVGKSSGERSRNPIQDIKSTFTYLRSATCEAILGVAGTEGTINDDGNGSGTGEPSKYEQWEIKCNEAGEGAKSLEDIDKWWSDNGAAIKKDLPKATAAVIYNMIFAYKKKFPAPEREPGEE